MEEAIQTWLLANWSKMVFPVLFLGGTAFALWRLSRTLRSFAPVLKAMKEDPELVAAVQSGDRALVADRVRVLVQVEGEAADRIVDQLMRFASRRGGLAAQPVEVPLDARQDGELTQFIASKRSIDAIKRYRELTNCSLKDAKTAVDELMRERHGR